MCLLDVTRVLGPKVNIYMPFFKDGKQTRNLKGCTLNYDTWIRISSVLE
jgi:hypothetical protein